MYKFGYSDGEKAAERAYPAEYAAIQVALNSSDNNNIELQSKNKVLTNELEMVSNSLKEALKTPTVEENISTLTEQESSQVKQPVKISVRENESSLFFDVLNVSVVKISRDENDIQKAKVTVSALNNKPESFSDLNVGDKRTYTTNDGNYEVLIYANNGFSVEVVVSKY